MRARTYSRNNMTRSAALASEEGGAMISLIGNEAKDATGGA
jgi:hypothetical protein